MAVCAPAHEAEDFDEVTAPYPKQRPLIWIKRVCVFYICVSAQVDSRWPPTRSGWDGTSNGSRRSKSSAKGRLVRRAN